MGTPIWLIDLGLETASTDESLTLPDLRQIATFFLGILFATSLCYFLHSPMLVSMFSHFLRGGTRVSSTTIDARRETISNASTSMSTPFDPLALVFILDLIYIMTAATQLGSLLSFSSAAGAVSCTFLVVCGALGSETVRLIGLLKLSIHLRERGASQWEKYILWGALTVSTIITFLITAVNTGVLRPISPQDSLSFCYTRHFFAGAAVTHALNLVIELFVLARFISLLAPLIPAPNFKLQVATDVQIYRSLSLIVLDVATVYPSLHPTSLLADFIPFSTASILILMAFNHNIIPKQSLVSSMLNPNQPLPRSIRIPTPNPSPFLNMESSTSLSKGRSPVDSYLDSESDPSIRVFNVDKGLPHPFADTSITSPHQRPGEPPRQWRSQNRVAGSAIERSGPLTDGMRDPAVVTANRTRLYLAEDPVFLTVDTLHMQLPRNNTPGVRRSRTEGSSPQRSFLPALGLTGPGLPSTSKPRGPNPPSSDLRMGRQILVRQAEMAHRMMTSPRPFHPGHRRLGSLSSSASHDNTASSTPPAPPRTQRILREEAHPMLILSENHINPGETRPSTTESGVVFGSDILLRSQDDIMRIGGEITEGSGGSREVNAGHGSQRRSSGSFGDQLALSFRIMRRSQQSSGASTGEGHGLVGDITRPHTGLSHVRTSVDALSVLHEGAPSPVRTGESHTSRKTGNAHKRPTFGVGDSLFDRFQRGFTFSDASSSHTAEHPAPILVHDAQRDSSRLSRLVPSSSLRSSTLSGGTNTRKQQEISQKRPST